MKEESDATAATNIQTDTNKMGFYGAISYFIGNILGAGLFITPASVLNEVNSVGLSLIIWSTAALISLLGAFCYIELATSIYSSGADFAYLCYVKWYPIAFAFMCVGCFVVYPATLAIQAETFSEYLIKGFHVQLSDDTYEFYLKKLIGFSLLWLLMTLNFFSLKIVVSRFQIVASVAKISATAIVICIGFYLLIFKGETQNLQNAFEGMQLKPSYIIAALFAGLFSYDGWDVLNFGAEEIKKPKRTMPMVIICGMLLVAFIFIATNISFFVVLSKKQMKSSVAVADTFAMVKLGNFRFAVPFLICIILIGSINTSLFCASRYLYVAARQGHLPAFLSYSNTEHDSPRVAIFLCVILSFLLSFAGNLSQLISYVSFCQWLQRIFTILALLWIRFTQKTVHPDAIQNPVIVPIIFLVISVTLVTTTAIANIHICTIGGSVLLSGFTTYFFCKLQAGKRLESFGHSLNNKVTVFLQIMFNVMPPHISKEEERTKPYRVNSSIPKTNCNTGFVSTVESLRSIAENDKDSTTVRNQILDNGVDHQKLTSRR
uniref:Amino acid permease n=1 Tax=Setaria digitata TaxID=48799 RepID=A0A915Q3H8_9BILA